MASWPVQRITHCVGSRGQPKAEPQLEDKFQAQSEGVLGAQPTAAALDVLWRLEELAHVRECARRLAP